MPYSERGTGFAVQGVTHWLRVVPGRVLLGLKAGGLPVALPRTPRQPDPPRHQGEGQRLR